ncbi:hypothetical protein FGB62_13g229 [Gracilaria domingensis]|nr:hypothetical protein FGB62_13g229 [Gracilaria domingensis]
MCLPRARKPHQFIRDDSRFKPRHKGAHKEHEARIDGDKRRWFPRRREQEAGNATKKAFIMKVIGSQRQENGDIRDGRKQRRKVRSVTMADSRRMWSREMRTPNSVKAGAVKGAASVRMPALRCDGENSRFIVTGGADGQLFEDASNDGGSDTVGRLLEDQNAGDQTELTSHT